jgi:hypothetical protein
MSTTRSAATRKAGKLEADRLEREAARTPGDPTPGAINPDLASAGPDAETTPEAVNGQAADPDASVWEAIGDPETPDTDGQEPGGLTDAEGSQAEPDADDIAAERAENRTPQERADILSETDPDAQADGIAAAVTAGMEPDGKGETAPEPAATTGKGKGRTPKAPKAPKAPKPPKVVKEPGLCVHGCGERTIRPQAQFVRGHDSILAKELRAAYASGDLTAEQVREHAGLISPKFLGKLNKSIAAVDAERGATDQAAATRAAMLVASRQAATKSA